MISARRALYGSVEVINVASGATRTWTGRSAPGYWPGVPAWAGTAWSWSPGGTTPAPGMIPAEITGVRRLDAAAPGGSPGRGTAHRLSRLRAGPGIRADHTGRR